ncbi:hypothetical protein KBD33_05825 [Candidatus Gracilibacteria bacterium]|nr:hypothetical protein [Candidatus Gracilibacteria bacterium]
MTKTMLQIRDSGSFFERAFSAGIEQKRITREKIESILEDGPHGVFQIAQKFEKPGIYTGLERARDRMVALVSLYLEEVTHGDIQRAINLINEKSILELSRGGSDMIKALGKKMHESDPDFTTIEGQTNNAYNMFRSHDPIQSKGLLLRYHEQLHEHNKKIQKNNFFKKILLLAGIDSDNIHSDDLILDVFPRVITGREIISEIYENYEKGMYDFSQWENILNTLRPNFPELCSEFSTQNCLKTLTMSFGQMKHNAVQEGEIQEDITLYKEWESLFPERVFHTTSEYITAVLTGGIEGKMKKSLTKKEFISLLEKARKQKFSLDKLESYIHDTVPPTFDLLRTITNRMDNNWSGILSKKSRITQNTYEVQYLEFDINILGK